MKIDGHIHSPYCPHGTKDTFYQYINRAIELGYDQITFTEHAPLPEGFEDPVPDKDSGMKKEYLKGYLRDLEELKKEFQNKITIKSGLEIDYIEGYEEETKQFLDTYGPLLDDSLLSVHFLLKDGTYDCLDFSSGNFEKMIEVYVSVDSIHQTYYTTVLKSVTADLGNYKPNRIGHITLADKFKKDFPPKGSFQKKIDEILKEVAKRGMELDYNGAGFFKKGCGVSYPPPEVARQAMQMGIPLVYGSDAHQAKDLNQGRDLMNL
ncbi:histidinol-phosphatase HisJ [Rossellomorea vietnamensis]|uniref:Histidinol-phosphatase n=1 Tax=Rossellomorea vietnamensis TaxID=218284 RepID=A0A5D4KIE7_9BACI|nr:histidinol-phosphatase HisJ [Rossellomorea vietnamensis]TYR76978.1 histidinol-phosphatase HisJ [Rossellomorea vietnamensis]